jgi:hypothetical protein
MVKTVEGKNVYQGRYERTAPKQTGRPNVARANANNKTLPEATINVTKAKMR